MAGVVEKQLTGARDQLLDLTLRNRLLNFRATRRTTVSIIDELPREVWGRLVTEGRAMSFLAKEEHEPETDIDGGATGPASQTVLPGLRDQGNEDTYRFDLPGLQTALDDRDELPERYTDRFLQTALGGTDLQTNLLRIYQRAQSILDEKGVNVLFLTMGSLRWFRQGEPERALTAPLVLVPVSLDRTVAGRRFRLRASDEDPVLNPCLCALLERDYRVSLPTTPEDWSSFDVDACLAAVRARVAPLGWDVTDDIVLGFLSFTKHLMYVDLDPSRWPADDSLLDHQLIRTFCGDDTALGTRPLDVPDAADLDEVVAPQESYQVLDADSSQVQAILAAKGGRSFVLVGPPGTGKSQTIANVVAECLASGRTVLFVSEKRAALEVVKHRLDAVGLGDFCLELHSTKATRKAVVQELGKVLHSGRFETRIDERAAPRLAAAREALNRYVKDLHSPHEPSGVTPFVAIGRVVQLCDVPDVLCDMPGFAEWDSSTRLDYCSMAERLGEAMRPVWPPDHCLWRGSRARQCTTLLQRDVRNLASQLRSALTEAQQTARSVASELGAPLPRSWSDFERLASDVALVASVRRIPEHLITDPVWDSVGADLKQLLRDLKKLVSMRHGFALRYDVEVIDLVDWAAINRRWQGYLQNALCFMLPRFWADRKQIRLARRKGYRPHQLQQAADLGELSRYEEMRIQIENRAEIGERYLGEYWQGAQTDVEGAVALGNRLLALRNRVKAGRVSQAAVLGKLHAGLDSLLAARDALRRSLDTAAAAWKQFSSQLMIEDPGFFNQPLDSTPIDEVTERLREMAAEQESLYAWTRYQDILQSCEHSPLADFVQTARAEGLRPEHYADAMEKQLYRLFVEEEFLPTRESLGRFDGPDHERRRRWFAEQDAKWVRETSLRLYARLSLERPEGRVDAANSSQLGILQGEMARRRGGRPIRWLLKNAREVITRLKPCFMMSPLSVAQFLEPGGPRFDLVVFDEASQVEPADALGAIARADQLVLVGDPRQLPPTRFFSAISEEDSRADGEGDGAASVGDMDSILDRGTMVLPNLSLRWHYRSRHDSLIAFSNKEFYDNRLLVFPASQRRGNGLGVHVEYHPEDWYDRGGSGVNRGQARRVSEWVFRHACEHPEHSVGVGAFSLRQQQAILDEVEVMRLADDSLEDFFSRDRNEPFFVKNLETIQGDERDVIVLSIGYGKTRPDDRLSMNFGPLNRDGGWRRLNVLVTRARKQCVVFTSVRPEDFDLNATRARGAHALHAYLHFAFTGAVPDLRPPTGDFDSDFERAVYEALKREGVEVHAQVGCRSYAIDLAVVDPKHPGRYVLGIECDGATYHSCAPARDRDRLRQQVLEDLGWRICRVWSTDWYRMPRREIDRLLSEIDRAMHRPSTPFGASKSNGRDEGSVDPDALVAVQSAAGASQPYTVFRPAQTCPADELYQGSSRPQPVIVSIVEVEGPIHSDELIRRVASAWSIDRVGTRVKEICRKAIDGCVRAGRIVRRQEFLWPVGMEAPPVRRRSDNDVKDIRLICLQEIGEAARRSLKTQFGMNREDLVAEAAKLLGFGRRGGRMAARIMEAIESEIANGGITEDDNKILHAAVDD